MSILHFDVKIVITSRDIGGLGNSQKLMIVMDALERAVVAETGAVAVDISYFGKRTYFGQRVRVYRNGSKGRSCNDKSWNAPLRRKIDSVVDRTIASFADPQSPPGAGFADDTSAWPAAPLEAARRVAQVRIPSFNALMGRKAP